MANQEEHYIINPQQDVLHVDFKGTWSPEETLKYVENYKCLVNRYFTSEWACVMNLQGLDMLLSESFQIETFKALNAWSYIKGMRSVAVVISNSNRSHLLYQFEEILKVQHPYATQVCFSEIESKQWLFDQGFSKRKQKLAGQMA
jgi:hypothetical protein